MYKKIDKDKNNKKKKENDKIEEQLKDINKAIDNLKDTCKKLEDDMESIENKRNILVTEIRNNEKIYNEKIDKIKEKIENLEQKQN